MSEALPPEDVELWRAFLRWSEQTVTAVRADIASQSSLSVSDFEVAIRLHDAGGELLQLSLGDALGWSASRLSHQLRRMEQRDLIERSAAGQGRSVRVALTKSGGEELAAAVSVHARSVRRNFLAPLDAHLLRDDIIRVFSS